VTELNYKKYLNNWRPTRNYRVVTKGQLSPGMKIDIGMKEFCLEIIYHPKTGRLCAQTDGGTQRDFIFWESLDEVPADDALFCVKG
jgi:hypothetical protein